MIEHGEFDTIYHEHVAYYSCLSVGHAMRAMALRSFDVERSTTSTVGPLRYWVGRDRELRRPSARSARPRAVARHGLDRLLQRLRCEGRVNQRRAPHARPRPSCAGNTIAAYGAAAKGATMLNTVGLGTDDIEFVVDRNTRQAGHVHAGTHQPILGVEALIERQPDYTLILAWNFADEIIGQQSTYTDRRSASSSRCRAQRSSTESCGSSSRARSASRARRMVDALAGQRVITATAPGVDGARVDLTDHDRRGPSARWTVRARDACARRVVRR